MHPRMIERTKASRMRAEVRWMSRNDALARIGVGISKDPTRYCSKGRVLATEK
ncbi:unnamed protein product [Mycena citricolor]|uniref:Uncharacterized protein n=1 Tax=Mycena citricolor TaxID=2018698 RepID=A0AAD2K3H7_9AGAR|nr:unnamed protein product [Mycena citricolor]